MTLACGRANKNGTIELSNAGHCLPIHVKKFDMVTINSTSMPIGLFCTLDYTFNKVTLEKGESLVLYSDGLSEAFNGEAEYGDEKIKNIVKINSGKNSKQLVQTLRDDLRSFMNGNSMKDDLTIMVISRTE
jgi:sigma-B regulation protein RsbU (phosphoserine phosphatase)